MTTQQLQEHLFRQEERLLHPDREADRTALLPLLADEFKEFGCSGRIFNREQAIDVLLHSTVRHAEIVYFQLTLLAPDVALVNYHTTMLLTTTLRSSIWVQRRGCWQILFHQGTVVPKLPL
ncbi:MAG: DUF4440 domain-containing protein [Acidobacteriota bacterium]|nr:DUF4440 domain-containing protein [Acidobacteriota bacterium]